MYHSNRVYTLRKENVFLYFYLSEENQPTERLNKYPHLKPKYYLNVKYSNADDYKDTDGNYPYFLFPNGDLELGFVSATQLLGLTIPPKLNAVDYFNNLIQTLNGMDFHLMDRNEITIFIKKNY